MLQRMLLSVHSGHSPLDQAPPSLFSSWDVSAFTEVAEAQAALKTKKFTVGLLLLRDCKPTVLTAITTMLESCPATQWVGVLPGDTVNDPHCRALIVQHLFDFHTWPIDSVRLNHTLGHAFGYAELSLAHDTTLSSGDDMGLVGQSAAIRHLRKQIAKVAASDAQVLIWGESGSGKELTAHAVHNRSPRAKGAFVALNCGAIPASLIQSELFGFERGAFTGAAKDKKGLIESAAGGTLFLDEIGDLPLELQANLLRFLQERTVNRIGASHSVKVDVRVIAASHMRLEDAVRDGRFREDLLYRLNVLPLTVPTLRERKEDLELLARHFFRVFASDRGSRLTGFSSRAMLAIKNHDWPGNVRELINRIRRAMVMAEGRVISPDDLGLVLPAGVRGGDALEEARVQAERGAIHDGLRRSGNNITHTARDLGVSRMTLYRLMEKHSISP